MPFAGSRVVTQNFLQRTRQLSLEICKQGVAKLKRVVDVSNVEKRGVVEEQPRIHDIVQTHVIRDVIAVQSTVVLVE